MIKPTTVRTFGSMAIVVGTYRERDSEDERFRRRETLAVCGYLVIKKERLDAGCRGGSPAAR